MYTTPNTYMLSNTRQIREPPSYPSVVVDVPSMNHPNWSDVPQQNVTLLIYSTKRDFEQNLFHSHICDNIMVILDFVVSRLESGVRLSQVGNLNTFKLSDGTYISLSSNGFTQAAVIFILTELQKKRNYKIIDSD